MNAFFNFLADSFHTEKLCSRLFSNKVRFLLEKGHFAFLSLPLGGGLGATYDVHLTGSLDFLSVIIEIFSLGATAEAL